MSETPTREEVARAIVRATSMDELDDARALREAYLVANPDDEDIQEMGELLTQMETVLKPKESHEAVTNEKQ